MQGRLTASLLLALIMLSALAYIAYALPRSEVSYAEVLLFDGRRWVSKYYMVKAGAITFRTMGSVVAVIRVDPATMLRPSMAYVDGRPYVPVRGAGMLWHSYTLVLDGGVHVVSVRFELSPPIQPFMGLFAPLPESEVSGEAKVRVPRLPGFAAAGARVTVIVSGPEELGRVVDKPFFVYNESTVSVVGKSFKAYELIVPYVNFTIKGPYVYAAYTPLYYVGSGGNIVVPPYRFRAAYANYPETVEVKGGGPNLVAGDPPHLYFGLINASSASFRTRMHRVELLIEEKDVCGGKGKLSYKVLLPPGAKYVGEHVYDLAENTSLVVRFFYGAVAVLDYRIDTPPPELIVTPPFYSLRLLIYDSKGHVLGNARYVLYSGGTPVASGTAENGTAYICPLPEGYYVVAVYVGDRLVGKRGITLESDSEAPILTETTTVAFRVIRLNVGDLLPKFNVTLSGGGLTYTAAAVKGVASVSGVPYGEYNVSIKLDGVLLYRGVAEVTPSNTEFTYALPVYRVRLKVLTAFGEPLSGVTVRLVGGNISTTGVTDEEGRVDLGFLPKGVYRVYVENDGSFVVTLSNDVYRVVTTDVVARLGGYSIRTVHIGLAAAALLALAVIAYISRHRSGRSGRIVEV